MLKLLFIMNVDISLINKLSELAKLEFSEKEKQVLQKDLEKIIGFFEQISALDTTSLEPLIYVNEQQNVFRTDEAKQLITREQGLKNTPKHDGAYILVPKVINK